MYIEVLINFIQLSIICQLAVPVAQVLFFRTRSIGVKYPLYFFIYYLLVVANTIDVIMICF